MIWTVEGDEVCLRGVWYDEDAVELLSLHEYGQVVEGELFTR